ncbi:DUF493 family protein [bacterium SCSIO 12741]|nr:DUF493 family protein [bacterium SCSIO 12741]
MSGTGKDFEALRAKLEEEGKYPKLYLFKFIIPSDNRTLALVEALFSDDAIIDLRSSRNGKYLSISAKEVMTNSDSIIQRYQEAMKIEGVIAL